jgi:HME family heavy-metal exporter
MSAGEPGKEILYPVATVILGGLVSSTLLDFFVHPAMFWLFGMRSAATVVALEQGEIPLVEEGEEPISDESGGRSAVRQLHTAEA